MMGQDTRLAGAEQHRADHSGKNRSSAGTDGRTRGGSHRFGENGCGRACQRPGGKFSY